MKGKISRPRSRSKKPGWQQDIAGERIDILMKLAGKEFKGHPERSNRYVELARKIGMRYNVRIPKASRNFCKKCYKFIVPGKNSVVRSSARTRSMETKCLECGEVTRMPYAIEKRKQIKHEKKNMKQGASK